MTTITLTRRVAVALLAAGLAIDCGRTEIPTAASPTSEPIAATGTATASCATGDGLNDACSCDADAHASCAGFYSADWQSYARANGYTTASWKLGLLSCLATKDVSLACAMSLDRREALNAQMMAACATYCRGISPRPGAEPCVDHLKSIYGALDTACRGALDAHEAAKPLETRGPF
jgi:hypothetical protein